MELVRAGVIGKVTEVHAGPFTETILLGNLANRINKKLKWDADRLRVTNAPEADKLIRRRYRKGWDIKV